MASRGPKAKYWCFTLNNPDEAPDVFMERFKEVANYVVFQEEKGDTGTPHYQGYIELLGRRELPGMKKLIPGAHWESRKGTQEQAITYCKKEDSRISGPYEFGDPSEESPGKRNDLKAFIQTMTEKGMRAAVDEDPCTYVRCYKGLQTLYNSKIRQPEVYIKREVIILYGPPGCGKTRTFYDREPEGCRCSSHGGFWFDGYMDDEGVLIDDFDGARSKWALGALLEIIDRYVIKVPSKGAFVQWKPQRIYITTNIHPKHWYEWTNRQAQYKALERRFTRIMHWGTDMELKEVTKDDEALWTKWWEGATEADDYTILEPSAQAVGVSRLFGSQFQSISYV